ncbi:MAG: TonB-dependent receptor [Aphanocapsa lilacina HA4352-LM1]|jgi:iron complex outermembrane receptor protein|nr:TonB-dependent receptor [Aphanocapsa lilacina HA4352-LM1]
MHKHEQQCQRLSLRTGRPICLGAVILVAAAAPVGAVPAEALAGLPQAVARSTPALTVPSARELLDMAGGQAADLKTQPPLWNWTQPVVSQAAPTPAAPAAEEPATAQGETPADNENFLDEVSVTATRRAVRQRDVTATVYSVKKEDFKAVGSTTVTDSLLLVPGFQAAPSLGGVRGIGETYLRGFNDQRFQALRDGLSLTRSSNGRSDIFGYQGEDLERIEVLTGGATLRYGSGSVGGVINLITETPKGPPKLTLQYETGSYGFNRYVAKYGGGDDVFSFNLTYAGVTSQNDYPFRYTVPNTAQFYGTTSNPNAALPTTSIPADPSIGRPEAIDFNLFSANSYPNAGTNGPNSFNLNGAGTNDPANSGPIDLYGFLKPEVGPPVQISGRLTPNEAGAASDSYSAKLVFKPDPVNRITARLNQQNRKYISSGPGLFSDAVCAGNASAALNPVFAGQRIQPLDSQGNPLPCDPQRYIVLTPSSWIASGQRVFPYSSSLSGIPFTPGNAYGIERAASVSASGLTQTNTAQTEVAVLWDHEVNPTTSINSYAYYYRLTGNSWVPRPYYYDSNLQIALGPRRIPGAPGAFTAGATSQPYFQSDKIEVQTSLNTKLSPGQDLSFGLNFTEDRSYQQQVGAIPFFDQAIARYSAFLIDDISFSDQLKVNAGLRYTSNSAFGELLTPAAGIRFTPDRTISLRANWSYVFNAPNLSAINVAGAGSLGNPNLRPETGVTYDVGLDFTPANNLGMRFTYFSTYLDGVFGTLQVLNDGSFGQDPQRFPILSQTVNLDGQLATGIEMTGDWGISDQVRLRVSWTNTDARPFGSVDSINSTQFPYFYQYQVPDIPFNNVIFNLLYRNQGMLASLVGRYDGGKRRINSLDFVPAWFTLDLNTEFPITPQVILTGSVFNIFDTQYEYQDGAPAPGTTFRVGARFEIGG